MTTAENVRRFAELPLTLEPELGRCIMSVREILALAPGSVIKLPRPVGAPVGLFVGGAPFGSGELIRTGDSVSIRITVEPRKWS